MIYYIIAVYITLSLNMNINVMNVSAVFYLTMIKNNYYSGCSIHDKDNFDENDYLKLTKDVFICVTEKFFFFLKEKEAL